MEIIQSEQNNKIKSVIQLKKSHARKKANLTIIEGRKEIELAKAGGVKVTSLFLCPEINGQDDAENLADKNTEINYTDEKIFRKISLRETPDGFLALAQVKRKTLDEINLSANPFIIVLESVEKPGNIGAVLRTADGVNADALIIAETRTDIHHPNAIRASRGTAFTVQSASDSNENIISWLKEKNIKIITASPEAEKNYFELDLTEPIALVFGEEHAGLSEAWEKASDEKIKIPMLGKIDSLNISVSAGVVAYEALRQRMRK